METIIEGVSILTGALFLLFLLFLLIVYPKINNKKRDVVGTTLFQVDSSNSGTPADKVFEELDNNGTDPDFLGED